MVAATGLRPGFEAFHHHILPVIHIRWRFGDQDPVRAGGERSIEGEIAAVASHHFDDERALMTGSRAGNGIHRIGDAVQGAVCADGHLGAGEIVVNRTNHADDHQVWVILQLFPR